MNNPPMPHTILLIDDDIDFCNALSAHAQSVGLNLHHRQNLDEGMDLLYQDLSILALILDTRCHIDEEDQGKAKTNFILHAINRIQDFEHEMNRTLPFCICTEHPEEYNPFFVDHCPVFRKTTEHNEMFNWLNEAIEKQPITAIENEYSDILEFCERYFSEEDLSLLLRLLLEMNQNDRHSVITNLDIIRRLEELLFDAAKIRFNIILDKDNPKRFLSPTKMIVRELENQRILPKFLAKSAVELYNFTSSYGSHIYGFSKTKHPYKPTEYSVIAAVYSLLEIFAWAACQFDAPCPYNFENQ